MAALGLLAGILVLGVPGVAGAANTCAKPAIPSSGAYLGAFVNPESGSESTATELAHLGEFEGSIARPLAIIHVYQSWFDPPTVAVLQQISDLGAIPMVDWNCGQKTTAIIKGDADPAILNEAETLRAYGKPVFLRWFWEMNLESSPNYTSCIGPAKQVGKAGPRSYKLAFDYIVSQFRIDGANNVAFVWNPSMAPTNLLSTVGAFYPGPKYVDWIGMDGYDRDSKGAAAFDDTFQAFYNQWSQTGKPMLVGETGANILVNQNEQTLYLNAVANELPTEYPDIKAFIYFDAHGADDWTLTPGASGGTAAFTALGEQPYFFQMPSDSCS